ncbi:4-hydroxy-2-oxoheptanedioate aldolase [Bradyrhizobium sp. LB7.1]
MRNDLPKNYFKAALRDRQVQIGFWLNLMSPSATEIAAGAGFDWLLIDMEHTANEPPDVVHHMRAAVGGTAEPAVRVPTNEPVLVKRLLDLGARTLLFPLVQSADEARAAVRATRYPPHGIRGMGGTSRATRYGRVPDYAVRAADELCVLVQVETRAGLAEIEAIAGVEGVDGVFIGPGDLSFDWGYPGQHRRPEIWKAILHAGERIRAAGKAAGFMSLDEPENRELIAAGFTFLAVGIDSVLLARKTDEIAKLYKS